MSKTEKLLLIGAVVAMGLIATQAFADNNSNNGNQNVIYDVSGAGNNVGNSGGGINGAAISNTANGGNSVNVNTAKGGEGGNAFQTQKQGQVASSSVKGSGNSSNSYVNKTAASTAFAAPLVASEDTCSGSSSGGAQGMGFGLSVGSTWQDGDCVRRKDARELRSMGLNAAAIALMCQNENVAKAMATAGTPCAVGELSPVAGKSTRTESLVTENEYPTGKRYNW